MLHLIKWPTFSSQERFSAQLRLDWFQINQGLFFLFQKTRLSSKQWKEPLLILCDCLLKYNQDTAGNLCW